MQPACHFAINSAKDLNRNKLRWHTWREINLLAGKNVVDLTARRRFVDGAKRRYCRQQESGLIVTTVAAELPRGGGARLRAMV